MASPTRQLATIALKWQSKPLSDKLIWDVRRATLDWFATTLPGCVLTPATLIATAFERSRGCGNAISYVDGVLSSARHAAFINATASHTVEFDDIFRDGGYHPGSPTISAALSVAQDLELSLERFQRAVIAGYEVGCRIALAVQPSHYSYWHTTSTVGTIGAATATALLLDCDEDTLVHAISLASSFAGGHQQNLQGKGMAKALHAGHAADAGILAAYAASGGVTSAEDALFGTKGFAAATSDSAGNWIVALAEPEGPAAIERMTVKNHGCCGHIFPALDGISFLLADHSFSIDEIVSVEVEGYAATHQMCNRPIVESAQEARFSAQYCIAALLRLGVVRLDAFTPRNLNNPEIKSLMPLIKIFEGQDLTADYPQKRQSRVTVRLKDGRTYKKFQNGRKGDPELPLTDQELIDKFRELAIEVLSSDEAETLLSEVLTGSGLPARKPLKMRNPHHAT